jgi:hypothetical protein
VPKGPKSGKLKTRKGLVQGLRVILIMLFYVILIMLFYVILIMTSPFGYFNYGPGKEVRYQGKFSQ